MSERTYPCALCHQQKPPTAFHRRSDRRQRRTRPVHQYCKVCRIENDRARHEEHRQMIDAEKQRRGACMDCGQTYPPYVMDFDHRPGERKLFHMSSGGKRKRIHLLSEMAKCDLVCANCHRRRTYARRQYHGGNQYVPANSVTV